jgi:hypothetical protein
MRSGPRARDPAHGVAVGPPADIHTTRIGRERPVFARIGGDLVACEPNGLGRQPPLGAAKCARPMPQQAARACARHRALRDGNLLFPLSACFRPVGNRSRQARESEHAAAYTTAQRLFRPRHGGYIENSPRVLPGGAVSLSWGRAAMSLARHNRQQYRRKPQRQPDQPNRRLLAGRAVALGLLGHGAITSQAPAHAVPELTRLPILDPRPLRGLHRAKNRGRMRPA